MQYYRKISCKKFLNDLNSYQKNFGVKIMKIRKSKFFLLTPYRESRFEHTFSLKYCVEPFREHFERHVLM